MELQWNIFYYDISEKKMRVTNIFRHGSFRKDVLMKFERAKNDRAVFEKALRGSLMYYFWCKCEWEVLLSPWPCRDFEHESTKIDVFWQIDLNWARFSDYVWNTLCGKEKEHGQKS